MGTRLTRKVPMLDEKIAYETMKNNKSKFGVFLKSCFHIHTPESYDYTLFDGWTSQEYKTASDEDLYKLCIERNVLPEGMLSLEDITLDNNRSCYKNKKELLEFSLLADRIIANGIEIVLVADHHTIEGVKKLEVAINELYKMKKHNVYPKVLLGVEISCADKNHVVGIFENRNYSKLEKWLDENLLSVEEGTFETSINVLDFIKSLNGIGYIAHIDTSDVFKEKYLSGAYKKKLFSTSVLNMVGLSNYDNLEHIKSRVKQYRSSEIKFIVDNDSHDIDSIDKNIFWIKGSNKAFSTIKEAFNDYDISVSFKQEQAAKQFIKGIYIENQERGFLSGNEETAFSLNFSNALNCLIGGRGTGKSTVLEVLEYILSQRSENERQLNFICSHGNSWILYEYNDNEYLIGMRMPVKSDIDDHIMKYFGQNPRDNYAFRYLYRESEVREYAFKKYLEISKIIHDKDEWFLEAIPNKGETLRSFFDTRYSVNDLVNTASSEKINDFIYDTLFENKILSKPEDVIRFKKRSGLERAIASVKDVLLKRKEEVDLVVRPFNNNQKNILRIAYSQDREYAAPNFHSWLFGNKYDEKKWYKKWNITQGDIIEYLLSLYIKVGLFEFLTIIVNEDIDVAMENERLLNFCTEMNPNMVEQGISSLGSEDEKNITKEIFSNLITESNIKTVIDYLKRYVSNIEEFILEFNINNKEGPPSAPIYRPVGVLSLGQKVVAMLSFVLGYSEYSRDYRPLIIDQPEDNLDNQYIYKNLVKQLRLIKEKRQVIIATHNATIVTNAKADQVCVMESDNKHGWVKTTGYPSKKQIKTHIINYLEGGKESFEHKLSIYKEVINVNIEE